MKRRRFMFWLGLGLFGLAEKLRADALDELAASLMRDSDLAPDGVAETVEHWTAANNRTWRWFERENLIDGRWKLTGITTPVHKATGRLYDGGSGYLDQSLVPAELRERVPAVELPADESQAEDQVPGHADPRRRARHGRPPSKWLRSLQADEIRIWLRTIDVPEAGVMGMTFLDHLTQDHSFRAVNVAPLTLAEQAKLHAAAHFGY